MAFKKTLVQRLFNLSRFSTPTLCKNNPNPSLKPQDPTRVNRIHQSASPSSTAAMRMFPLTGEGLTEKLKGLDITKGRLNLDGMVAPYQVVTAQPNRNEAEKDMIDGLSMTEVRKVIRATQVEMVREKLKNVEKDWVNYKEFVEIIEDFCGGNKDQALLFAKMLDDSGSVIVIGNSVCLHPHQEIRTLVAKVIHSLVTPPMFADPNDPRRKELELMEEMKVEIDQKAEALVRRELWAGLGYMVVQTAAFMRLTFWELSWDVMEPICFYVTSFYFMLGYTFFLRTSKEPSFEGFFKSRFNAKQKRLMKTHEFNLERYIELREVLYPHSPSSVFPSWLDDARLFKLDCHKVN